MLLEVSTATGMKGIGSVTQDHIGVYHMKTNMTKKASEHVYFRAHTKNTAISTDKSVVSGSSHDQCDCSFA
jgi:hypothetical protein